MFALPTLAGEIFPLITGLDQLYFEGSGELEASFDYFIYNIYASIEIVILVMAVDCAEQNKTVSFRKIWHKLWVNKQPLTLVLIFILFLFQMMGNNLNQLGKLKELIKIIQLQN